MESAERARIFADRDLFSDSYLPGKLPSRERQAKDISRCLAPALKKRKPIHLWLYGKPGAGKTTTALHVLNEFKKKSGVQGILINCWEKDTFFEILDEIISRLRIFRAEEQRTSLKLQKFRGYLKDQPFIIVLDEVDQLRPAERSAALYNLNSLENVGLVCISNSRDALFDLDERVRSRLDPYAVFFPPYSSESLLRILGYRAEQGFAPCAWSEKALKRIADMAKGDARVAIQSLRNVAELAEQDNRERISLRGLEKHWERAKAARRTHVLRSLTHDHRMLYRIVKQRHEILSGELWEEYLARCHRLGRKPLACRTLSDYANRLVRAGLITSERARVKGKVRLFKVMR